MGLTGLAIYKHLPKTNCKECGLATCLAFAMKVAAGQTTLDKCTQLSDDARGSLDGASAPPQALIEIGAGESMIELGRETVLYRHEERFRQPTALAIAVDDNAETLEAQCREIAALKFERMGATLEVDLVAVRNASGQADVFAKAAAKASEISGKPLALISSDAACLRAAGEAVRDKRPLLWAMDAAGAAPTDAAAMAVAKELDLPLCLTAPDFDTLVATAEAARSEGLKNLMLSLGPQTPSQTLEFLSQSRRAAIVKKFRPLGYPVAAPVSASDPDMAVVEACWYVLKYAGVVLVETRAPEDILAILTTRQDIYTNPQIPVQVESGLHVIGNPGPDAPVMVTTNFALSYYSVESEVESSRVPSYVLAVDTEGTSVLTAWAADKFNAESITATFRKSGLDAKVQHKKIIIPGHVAVLCASIMDESGLEVLVGPKEASGLVSYLKTQWKP